MARFSKSLAVGMGLGMWCISMLPQAHADEKLIRAGEDIARQHCTRCHVVGDLNPHGGISSTPSFQLMVNALSDWLERFETFHVRRPHPAVVFIEGVEYVGDPPTSAPIRLKFEDIDAIVAFAKTLTKPK